MDEGTKKILIVGLVIVGLVGLVSILVVTTTKSSTICGITLAGPPKLDPSKEPNKATEKNEALVHAVSYVIILDQPGGFLETKLDHINTAQRELHDINNTNLDLTYDCAKTVFEIDSFSDLHFTGSFSLFIMKDGSLVPYCHAVFAQPITWKRGEYYSCLGQQVFDCISMEKDARGNVYAKSMAEVVFEALEIELDGDAGKHAKGEFAGKPDMASCPSALVTPLPTSTTSTAPSTIPAPTKKPTTKTPERTTQGVAESTMPATKV